MAICHGALGSRGPLGRKLAWVTSTSWPILGSKCCQTSQAGTQAAPRSGSAAPATEHLSLVNKDRIPDRERKAMSRAARMEGLSWTCPWLRPVCHRLGR